MACPSARITAIAVILGLNACATDVANRYYGTNRYAPRPVEQVQVLHSAPNQPYDVIADFQSRGDTEESMRARAAEIGADAVIVVPLGGNYAIAEEWADKDRLAGSGTRIVGTAIKYRGR